MLSGETGPDNGHMELRAGERVRHYLLTQFEPPQQGESRLPTNKELARLLEVSPGTVQSALRQLAREGRIRSRRGSGTFLVSARQQPEGSLRVGISIPVARLQDHNGWLHRIGGGMFQASLGVGAILEGVTPTAFSGTDRHVEELIAKRDSLHALVIFPYSVSEHRGQLIDAYEREGKPVVDIHPPFVGATANFVSTDFFHSSFTLAAALRHCGRRRFLKLTNHSFHQPRKLHHAVSHNLRQMGWVIGSEADIDPQTTNTLLHAAEATQEDGHEALRSYLAAGNPAPDAIYCSGDWLALGALQALEEAGIAVPEQASVIGASGMDLSWSYFPNLTRVRHSLEEVGRRAIEMAMDRLAHPGSRPGILLPTSFIGGGTTRPEENKALGIQPPLLQAKRRHHA